MDIEAKKRFATLFFQHMGDKAVRHEALAMMTDDATWWIPGIGTWDKAQLAAGMGAADACFTGKITPKILGITAEGDRVAVESESQADVINGTTYNNRYHCLLLFRGDRISEVREYCDTKYAADTLGALLAL